MKDCINKSMKCVRPNIRTLRKLKPELDDSPMKVVSEPSQGYAESLGSGGGEGGGHQGFSL